VPKVYFVGCGPGDPDLITIKAKKLIQKADVVVYSGSLIPSQILKMCKNAKTYDASKLVREEIFNILKKNAKKGKNVVRLHDGDPTIYGAIREQMDNLYKEKINSEIIAKVWKKKAEFKNLNIFIIGNYILIKRQLEKIKVNLNLKKISKIQKQNFKKKLLITVFSVLY